MKKFTLFSVMSIIAISLSAQPPQSFKYQAVARDNAGNVIADQAVSFRISILRDSVAGSQVYKELHSVTTNQFGLVNLDVGNGAAVFGSFGSIPWHIGSYFLKLEMDTAGGNNYQFLGTSQLLSVPYALNASSLTLTDENGNHYSVGVDSLGNLTTKEITPWQCGDTMTDIRDGQRYGTVQIGQQCWMAQDMNIGTMISGTNNMTNNSILEKYCYEDNAANCDVYGGLYMWNEMMQYSIVEGIQGICPYTWHIPSDAEWTFLIDFLGGASVAGGKMKETGTTHWASPNTGATNESGFTALPGGRRASGFGLLSIANYLWSSTKGTSNSTWVRVLSSGGSNVDRGNYGTSAFGFSVRCVQGEWGSLPPALPSDPLPASGSVNQLINLVLSWTCIDPENTPLTYDVYFGTSNPPPSVTTGQTSATYHPTSLSYSTQYFWKIIAHDSYGNATEGPVWTFTTKPEPTSWQECGDMLVDSRDGQQYTTIAIGTQCWMAENLNIGLIIQGDNDMANNSIFEKYCYEDNTANCDIYGGLYQWDEMMGYTTQEGIQGICPEGWHIPTFGTMYGELWTLIEFLGISDAGGKMKEAGLEHWNSPNTGATNESGFTGLPGGYRWASGFSALGNNGNYWSSSVYNLNIAYYTALYYNSTVVSTSGDSKLQGYSVRCLKDPDNQPPAQPSDPFPSDGASNVGVGTTLSWFCTDPDGDDLTFKVHFGTINPPPFAVAGLTNTTYDPGLLDYNTSYYWKVVAFDSHGDSAVGNVWTFITASMPVWTCGDVLVDARDSQNYNTVQIGTQCWMAENLNIGIRIDGILGQTNNGIIEKYCQNNIETNCDTYGGLYQWDETMLYTTQQGAQGICPVGWHLPTDAEWCTMTQYIDPTVNCSGGGWQGTDVGTKMKSTTGWAAGGNGTNSSGFNGLPAGSTNLDGTFCCLTSLTQMWSSTLQNSASSYQRKLHYSLYGIEVDAYNKLYGFSVRCIKD